MYQRDRYARDGHEQYHDGDSATADAAEHYLRHRRLLRTRLACIDRALAQWYVWRLSAAAPTGTSGVTSPPAPPSQAKALRAPVLEPVTSKRALDLLRGLVAEEFACLDRGTCAVREGHIAGCSCE